MANAETSEEAAAKAASKKDIVLTYAYILVWICLSSVVIMVNKYILSYTSMKYPIFLTLTHMAFCGSLAAALLFCRVTEPINIDIDIYLKCVIPIAGLFAGTLWLGNAAYLYLSVAFIQMVKAMMPMCVYAVACLLGTEKYAHLYAVNIVVVTIGVCIASYGEINFNLIGVVLQGSSLLTESFRLVLIQILLQSRGIKMNPIHSLYYIAPACFGFLMIPFLIRELPMMVYDKELVLLPGWLLASASAAFALNVSVFLLIGKSSALTMNLAGVVKDWLLICLSVVLYKSPVTLMQYCGYGLSFLGLSWYNYNKVQAMKPQADAGQDTKQADQDTKQDTKQARQDIEPAGPDSEQEPLLANGK